MVYVTGALTGNADTATTLANARNFSISGDITANAVSFDGSGNVALTATIDNTGVSAGSYGSGSLVPVITVNAKDRLQVYQQLQLQEYHQLHLIVQLINSQLILLTVVVLSLL